MSRNTWCIICRKRCGRGSVGINVLMTGSLAVVAGCGVTALLGFLGSFKMAYGDPYCGKCHKFMTEWFHDVWVCDCTIGGGFADTTKDPNCHNSGHDHHDPLSPIVLAQQVEYAEEERVEEEARRKREEPVCGHYKDVDGICTFWGCPSRGAPRGGCA